MITQKEIIDRNNRAIPNVFETMTRLIAQVNYILQTNKNGEVDEFCGLKNFSLINLKFCLIIKNRRSAEKTIKKKHVIII